MTDHDGLWLVIYVAAFGLSWAGTFFILEWLFGGKR